MSHKPFLDLAERVSLVMHIDLPWDKPRSEPKCVRCGGEPDYEAVTFLSDQCDEDLSQALCKACAGLGIPSGWSLTVHPSKARVVKLRADGFSRSPDGKLKRWRRGSTNQRE